MIPDLQGSPRGEDRGSGGAAELYAHVVACMCICMAADVHGYKSKDGKEPMSNGYREAVNLINNRRMGMNLAVLMKIPSGGNNDSKL